VQAAEDAWNTRDPEKVALAYTPDSVWRNRETFVTGREQIIRFLTRKWEKEQPKILSRCTRAKTFAPLQCIQSSISWRLSCGHLPVDRTSACFRSYLGACVGDGFHGGWFWRTAFDGQRGSPWEPRPASSIRT
jgi:uncharacterized protein (TIGR02246 family)